MTLTTIGFDKDPKSVSEIGSMLFKRAVSGTRVVTGKEVKKVEGFTFKGRLSFKKFIFVLSEGMFLMYISPLKFFSPPFR